MEYAPDVEEAVAKLAIELGATRDEMLARIIREWLESGGNLPVSDLEDESEE